MAKFLYKTKGESDLKGKPRLYFTCHPDDFKKYFDKICEDIFKTHNCVIYYTENMTEEIAEEDKSTDLGQMNLFVVPVTYKLLSTPNRAMDSDIAYAKSKNILILPFMMESGIDSIYSMPNKFGERQYISPFSGDLTEIKYEDKLRKFFDSVLISDEMADKVRKAFDAYIFLSYRKKDRRYANELMRLIHGNPKYRDIAIWYDEFLTPGESFKANIEKALKNSKLFTLLVTPNLLEEPDGKPNFIMENEYPMAKDSKMDIIPAEMAKTDRSQLEDKFNGIPDCVDPNDKEGFEARLATALVNIAREENDNDPEHNFLIGLAYLEGIDVEIDSERAIELITSAAKADIPAAMEKLFLMYRDGKGAELDYKEAAKWAEKTYKYRKRTLKNTHHETLKSLNDLAYTYGKLGNHKKALTLNKKAYILLMRKYGKHNPETLMSLSNLAYTYGKLGYHKKACTFALRLKKFYEGMPDTPISLSNLAYNYCRLGDYQKACELNEKAYALRLKNLGEEHVDTLTALSNLAYTYGKVGNHEKAFEYNKKAFSLRLKKLGEEHPDTLMSLSHLAYTYGKLGSYEKACELNEKAYTLRLKKLGVSHIDTLISLSNWAYTCGKLGDYKKSCELNEKAYTLRLIYLGEDHPDTLISMNCLAYTYDQLGDYKKAYELDEKAYLLRLRKLGDTNPNTLMSLGDLAYDCSKLGDYKTAHKLQKKLYDTYLKLYGAEDEKTIATQSRLEEFRRKMDE